MKTFTRGFARPRRGLFTAAPGRLTAAVATALALTALMVAPVGASGDDDDDGPSTYRITVENLTGGQPITPVVAAASDGDFRFFRRGRVASPGLQQLAENGGVPLLAAEAASSPDVDAVEVIGSAPIAPGASIEQIVTLPEESSRLSLAAMLVCSNDGFAGVSRLRLPEKPGRIRTVYARAFDAGTELNTEAYSDLVPPCDGMGGSGMSNPVLAENGVVRRHRGIAGGSDLVPAVHGWDRAVLKITVEKVRVYEVSVSNLTGGQPLTPFVLATHDGDAAIFRDGRPASPGLQQLSENGGVPVLAGELAGLRHVGTVAVVGSAPIGPGGTVTSTVLVTGRDERVSLAGMLVCSNDGFAGVDDFELPEHVGDTEIARAAAYDAGTELNTEAYGDLVPPCDGMGGSGTSNPALAEGGVVRHHSGISGIADLDASIHGWTGAVASISITRVG